MRCGALVVLLLSAPAFAQDAGVSVQFDRPLSCEVDGRSVTLQPGVAMPQAVFNAVEAEVIRAQTEETRLRAQNRKLDDLLANSGGISITTGVILLSIGLAVGIAGTLVLTAR